MYFINLSVVVWVGFIVFFGVVMDDGVLMGMYIYYVFLECDFCMKYDICEVVVEVGLKCVCFVVMIMVIIFIVLFFVFIFIGKGVDIMVLMVIFMFGGMLI